jgi:hypothetical protein
MLGADSALALGRDFAIGRSEAPEESGVLVIKVLDAIHAVVAGLGFG